MSLSRKGRSSPKGIFNVLSKWQAMGDGEYETGVSLPGQRGADEASTRDWCFQSKLPSVSRSALQGRYVAELEVSSRIWK